MGLKMRNGSKNEDYLLGPQGPQEQLQQADRQQQHPVECLRRKPPDQNCFKNTLQSKLKKT